MKILKKLVFFLATITSVSYAVADSSDTYDFLKPFLAPKVWFHYGNFDNLIQDVQNNGVPQDVWDKHIMTSDDRFHLVTYRQGFYGCSAPSWCWSFADVAKGTSPWFVKVTLTDECLEPKNLVVPHLLGQDPRFLDWLGKQDPKPYSSTKDFEKACLLDNYLDLIGGHQGPCELTVAKFLIDTNVKIVMDEALPDTEDVEGNFKTPNSWYFRDPKCISGIDGAPEQVVSTMLTPNYWVRTDGTNFESASETQVSIRILSYALSQSKNILNSDKIQSAIQGIQKVEGDKSSKPFSIFANASILLGAYERCASKNKPLDFDILASQFVTKTQTPDEIPLFQKDYEAYFQALNILCLP